MVFPETDLRARAYVKGLCAAAGLAVREDAVGNTFARWQGAEPALPAVGTGSHIDAIPNAGRYDGTVGVLGGLEAIRALQRAGFRPRRSIELMIFTSEEPTRFGIGCLGQPPAGRHAGCAARAARLRDTRRPHARRSARRRRLSRRRCRRCALPPGYYSAFVELHIEQGPLLERDGDSARHRHRHRRAGQPAHVRSKARAAMPARC